MKNERTMAGKYQRVDKKYILSDSSVNCYGFRLLTSGYQADEYLRNPIGYYMHDRDGGVLVSWQDIATEGDNVTGFPVINLSNERGEQTLQEATDGFLNAASMGHIVVLEYSVDPEQMLPGQTGPTITKWYNKECSLVDIPGNSNALTQLYDTDNNLIALADLGKTRTTMVSMPATLKTSDMKELQLSAETMAALCLAGPTDATGVEAAINSLAARATKAETDLATLRKGYSAKEVATLLDAALAARKITVELRNTLAADYTGNPAGLKALLMALPTYTSITERLTATRTPADETTWTWDDYERNDASGKKLSALRASDPERYKELFLQRFPSA